MNGTAALTGRSARDALASVACDAVDLDSHQVSRDPLGFPGYAEQLERARRQSGETESVVVAEAQLGGTAAIVVSFDFDFLGGSMGEATGDRLLAAIGHARARHVPLVSLVATGGARIQEGMRSLIQMQKLAEAVTLLRRDGVPHICLVRNPTTGGVWVAFASTADVILGLEGASNSFAGARVRRGGEEPGEHFSTAGKYEAGFIDVIVAASDAPRALAEWVDMLAPANRPESHAPCPLPRLPRPPVKPATGWEAVQRARDPARPRAMAYLADYCETMLQISGDRAGGRDPEMLCGFARHDGEGLAFAAQTGGASCAAGFRTAARLFRLARRFRFPVLTLIDTPGALDTAAAEEAGIGTAMGEAFVAMAELDVPVTSVVIGEGGSGGALALAKPGRLWAAPDSYFSVTAPEGAAAILYKDPGKARDVASNLQLGPAELVELGIVRGILTPAASHSPMLDVSG
jgi:acetyl-CoA carboxylase alpha subunit